LLAAIGTFLGVLTLIVVLAVMQGFRNTLLEKVLDAQGHITVIDHINGKIENYEQIESNVAKNAQVISVKSLLEKQLMCIKDNQGFGVLMHGVTEKNMQKILKKKIIHDQIYVGKQLAKDFNLKVNDQISLISAQTIDTPFGSSPRMSNFKIGGIIDFNFFQHNKMLLLTDLKNMQNFIGEENAVNNIIIHIKNPDNAIKIAQELQKLYPNLNFIPWQEFNITFAQVLDMQKNIMFIVISLMIIIASFNGISGIMMMVQQKRKELALLKILGASKTNIMLVFLAIGLIITIVSIVLGLIVGLVVLYNMEIIRSFLEQTFNLQLFPEDFYHMTTIPFHIDFYQIMLIVGWCFFIALCSIVYPCWKALQVDPDEELRM